MTTPDFKRKLAAIFHADVKGYSRLMGEDEEATLETLTLYLDVMCTLIAAHRGRVVGTEGDAVLAEFASVVDAARCAVEVQEALKQKNADLPVNRRMEFRIGINLGDIIEEGDQIYGDGVNIAARIESLADGGGISVSETVYHQIDGKLSLGYEFQGEQPVKNIKKPVKVYRVLVDPEPTGRQRPGKTSQPRRRWILAGLVVVGVAGILAAALLLRQNDTPPAQPPEEAAYRENVALPLPQKPSIAVLPFTNMSDDPADGYFSDGMTDDLITDLSKISGLFVIARNSVFVYKGKNVNIEQISRELGVRYVLEGSVRRAGGNVRINAQLIDSTTGGHVWAERYDRNLKDIFALQDEVTNQIVEALVVNLTKDELSLLERKGTKSIEAYDQTLRGTDLFYRFTQADNAAARKMFRHAIDADPEYAAAYCWLGWTYWMKWAFEWRKDPGAIDQALNWAHKALAVDESLSSGLALVGKIHLWQKQYDRAIAELKKLTDLYPNYADGIAGLGEAFHFAGRSDEAISMFQKAIRLNPIPPVWYFHGLGAAYYLTGRHDRATIALKRVLRRNPNFWPSRIYLAASYSEQGDDEKARAEVAEILRIAPNISSMDSKKKLPYKDPAVLERLNRALGKAGLKE